MPGEATPDARTGIISPPLNRLARLLTAGHGTQILLTEVVERLVAGSLPDEVTLRPLGGHRLRDLHEPEEVFQVLSPGLPDQFPPLHSLPQHPTNGNRFHYCLGASASARTSASSIASSIESARPASQSFLNRSSPSCSMTACRVCSLRSGVTPHPAEPKAVR